MSLGEQRYVNATVAGNDETDNQIRTMAALLTGVAAGVMGLTGLVGALFFFAAAAVTSLIISAMACNGEASVYFPGGSKELFALGRLMRGLMTYILAWTVVYDAIYIF